LLYEKQLKMSKINLSQAGSQRFVANIKK